MGGGGGGGRNRISTGPQIPGWSKRLANFMGLCNSPPPVLLLSHHPIPIPPPSDPLNLQLAIPEYTQRAILRLAILPLLTR